MFCPPVSERWSSRFGSNKRYGTFWSVGAAWNITEETFMQNLKLISLLKLRASYGVNGNAGIGNYDWRATYSVLQALIMACHPAIR